MMLSGEEYSKRLRGFSDDTMRLIMKVNGKATEENISEINRIKADPNLTEEQIVQKLKEFLASE